MLTSTISPVGRPDYSTKSHRQRFLARLFKRVLAAQEARADRVVKQHLATFTDQQLADLGHSSEAISAIRRYPAVRVSI